MASSLLAQVREGMEVNTADGKKVGKIDQVWIGTDPAAGSVWCDEDICSRLEVHHAAEHFYIPFNAIADVSGRTVTLNVDAATVHEKGWYRRPTWIVPDEDVPAISADTLQGAVRARST